GLTPQLQRAYTVPGSSGSSGGGVGRRLLRAASETRNPSGADSSSLTGTHAPTTPTPAGSRTPSNDPPPYLRACVVYLSPKLSETKQKHLDKVVVSGGGARATRFPSSKVTHFVTLSAQLAASDRALLATRPHDNLRVVTQRWLQDCYSRCQRVDEAGYAVSLPAKADPEPMSGPLPRLPSLANTPPTSMPPSDPTSVADGYETPTPLNRRAPAPDVVTSTPPGKPGHPLLAALPGRRPITVRKSGTGPDNFASPFPVTTAGGTSGRTSLRAPITVFRPDPALHGGEVVRLPPTPAAEVTGRRSSTIATTEPPSMTASTYPGVVFTALYFTSEQTAIVRQTLSDPARAFVAGHFIEDLVTEAILTAPPSDWSNLPQTWAPKLRAALAPYMLPSPLSVYLLVPLAGSASDQLGRVLDAFQSAFQSPGSPFDLHIVTECWLERCLAARALIDEYAAPLYRPLPVDVPHPAVRDRTVAITGFDGLERQHLLRLLGVLGARGSEKFSRRHDYLVCRALEGPKYDKAQEWGIPAVGVEWLFGLCAPSPSLAITVESAAGLVEMTAEASSTSSQSSMHLYATYTPARSGPPAVSAPPTAHSSCTTPGAPVPAAFLAPSPTACLFLPHAPPVHDPPTPLAAQPTSVTRRPLEGRFSLDSPSGLQFDLTGALSDLKTPTRPNSYDSSLAHLPMANPQGVADSAEDLTERPLKGLVLGLSSRLSHRRTELVDLARDLGAEVVMGISHSCTHFIHQGSRTSETFGEFRVARESRLPIVSPWWLQKCHDDGQHHPEAMYPHTFNPMLMLELQPVAVGSPLSMDGAPPPPGLPPPTAAAEVPAAPPVDAPAEPLSAEDPTGLASKPELDEQTPAPLRDYSGDIEALLGQLATPRNSRTQPKRRYRLVDVTANQVEPAAQGADLTSAPIPAVPVATYAKPDRPQSPDEPMATLRLASQEPLTVQYTDPDAQAEKSRLLSRLRGRPTPRTAVPATPSPAACQIKLEPRTDTDPRPEETGGPPSGRRPSTAHPPLPTSEEPPTVDTLPMVPPTILVPRPVDSLSRSSVPGQPGQLPLSPSEQSALPIMGPPPRFGSPTSRLEATALISPTATASPPAPMPLLTVPSATPSPAPSAATTHDTPPPVEPVSLRAPSVSPPMPSAPSMAAVADPSDRVFQFSGIPNTKRHRLTQQIIRLGGRSVMSEGFDPACTHMIVSYANQSEKITAAVAAGRWLLKATYIERSAEAGHFLPEADHTLEAAENITSQEERIIKAAHQWRRYLTSQVARHARPVGAFQHWRVLLGAQGPRHDGYVRLLKAGGAQVEEFRPNEQREQLSTLRSKDLTHFILDVDLNVVLRRDLLQMLVAEKQCLCVDINFIKEFLALDHDETGLPLGLPPWQPNPMDHHAPPSAIELETMAQCLLPSPLVREAFDAHMVERGLKFDDYGAAAAGLKRKQRTEPNDLETPLKTVSTASTKTTKSRKSISLSTVRRKRAR
ncbi:protein kinase activating protein dpb11, partial [Tieghemiomyces parasiticus]